MLFRSGIRFDLSAICLLMAPYLLVNAYVGSHQKNRWWRLISNSYFYLVVLISTLLNLIDIAWFEYTGKRTTSDIFSLLALGNDINNNLWFFSIRNPPPQAYWIRQLVPPNMYSIINFNQVEDEKITLEQLSFVPQFCDLVYNSIGGIEFNNNQCVRKELGLLKPKPSNNFFSDLKRSLSSSLRTSMQCSMLSGIQYEDCVRRIMGTINVATYKSAIGTEQYTNNWW